MAHHSYVAICVSVYAVLYDMYLLLLLYLYISVYQYHTIQPWTAMCMVYWRTGCTTRVTTRAMLALRLCTLLLYHYYYYYYTSCFFFFQKQKKMTPVASVCCSTNSLLVRYSLTLSPDLDLYQETSEEEVTAAT